MTLQEAKDYINYGIKEGYIHDEDYWIELLKRNPIKFTIEVQTLIDRSDAAYEARTDN